MMTSRKRQRLVRTATACCIGVAAATATNESSLDRLASSVSSWWRPLHDESAASLLVAVEPRRDKIRLDRELENEDEEEDNNKDDEEEDDKQDENEQQEDDEGDDQDDNKNDGDAKNDDGANQGEDDDFFDDAIQDDQYSDDIVFAIDDFYAYQEDPRPPTLFPLTARTVIGYFIASLALTLGCSGGSGGGGILIPVYILVMGLPLKIAVPSGAVTVLGGAMGSTMLNWSRRHPLADRPLIDWDLVLVMEPLVLVGTFLGTLFHQVLSEKFLVVLLVLLLSITAHMTLTKAMRMYHAEKRYIRHLKAAQAEPPSGSPPRNMNFPATWDGSQTATGEISRHHDPTSARSLETAGYEERQRILILNPDYVTLRTDLMDEEKYTPRTKILALMIMFSVVIFLNVMVGGGAYKSPWGIRCGGVSFWTVNVIIIAVLLASAWAAQTYVVARHEIKELVRFDYVHGDIIWNAKSAVLYPLIFVSAGLFAGTLGIGGGVITVPLMLHFGLHPAVASASSSAMILFTSFASSTSFIVFGLLLPDFALVGFCTGFFASLTGQTIMRQARQAKSASGRNFERNSYIAFVIGGVVLISALLMTIQYVLLIVEKPDDSGSGLCDGLRL